VLGRLSELLSETALVPQHVRKLEKSWRWVRFATGAKVESGVGSTTGENVGTGISKTDTSANETSSCLYQANNHHDIAIVTFQIKSNLVYFYANTFKHRKGEIRNILNFKCTCISCQHGQVSFATTNNFPSCSE
jgi:hypothetical protein